MAKNQFQNLPLLDLAQRGALSFDRLNSKKPVCELPNAENKPFDSMFRAALAARNARLDRAEAKRDDRAKILAARPTVTPILINRGTSAQKRKISTDRRPKKTYSDRLQDKLKTKGKLVSLLRSIGEDEQADKVNRCGSRFRVVTCGSHIIARTPFEKCDFRYCPFCAARRAQKFADKYHALSTVFIRRYAEWMRKRAEKRGETFTGGKVTPVHLTLTQSHIVGETYAQSRARLLGNFKKLTRRKFWKENFAGAVVGVETTVSKDGCWHVHLHLTAFRRRFFDTEALRLEWLAVTGDSYVLRLDEIEDLGGGLRETIKYAVKPSDIADLTSEQMRQLLAVKGSKNLFPIGEFAVFCAEYELTDTEQVEFAPERQDLRIRDDDGEPLGFVACPHCNGELFEIYFSSAVLLLHAREIENALARDNLPDYKTL